MGEVYTTHCNPLNTCELETTAAICNTRTVIVCPSSLCYLLANLLHVLAIRPHSTMCYLQAYAVSISRDWQMKSWLPSSMWYTSRRPQFCGLRIACNTTLDRNQCLQHIFHFGLNQECKTVASLQCRSSLVHNEAFLYPRTCSHEHRCCTSMNLHRRLFTCSFFQARQNAGRLFTLCCRTSITLLVILMLIKKY